MDMIKSRGFAKQAGLVALVLGGVLVSPAAASERGHAGHGGRGGVHVGHGSCDWRGHLYAGTIQIDGCRTTIRGDCDIRAEIVRAFRAAGYHAYIQKGSVVVQFDRRRPVVRWYSEGYRTNIYWDRGCLSISLFSSPCGSCSPKHVVDRGHGQGRGRHGRTYDRWTWSNRDHRGRWNRNRCD